MTDEGSAPVPARLKVVLIDHSADPGGGQLGLLRYLRDVTDFDVSVILLTGGALVGQIRALGHRVTVIDDESQFSFSRAPRFSARLAGVVRRESPDVIVANSLYSTITMAFARLPRNITRIYYSRVSMETLRGIKRVIAMRLLFRQFDGFLANSEWTASCIPRRLARRPVRVAYPISGVDETSSAGRVAPSGTGEELVIASLSRPDRWKGTDILIEAVAQLEPIIRGRAVRLEIYGGTFFSDPVFVTEVERLARESPVPVSFRGHVDDVDSVLDRIDVMVLSTRFPEPFGQVVVQGLAHGAVVVVPDQGGPLEVVTDGVNGLTFSSGRPEALRDVLDEVLRSPEKMSALTGNGKGVTTAFGDHRLRLMFEASVREIHEAVSQTQSRPHRRR
ncbi:glycosyltransferase involved in cell wall biosynthesis [Frigoribacterium sp. PhB160]|uniref:glycosyltransferase family 4 protein n=1 Tax=Frigoribacterium sp. PhB160 TaxID=2485192 RepID=UPI000F4AA853|nr:glycosyltransferase family 4 protein [Frigoribacterium sp. PhB160]ROS60971.1 glycosyltransferase involved in cell wall biosynthesis [Frigoribacterium sp. PhB160]